MAPPRTPPQTRPPSLLAQESEEFSARKKRAIFVVVAAEQFIAQLGFAILAPLFPKEAESKQIGGGVAGWVFGVFQLAVVAFTPISAKLMPGWGPTRLLNIGNFLNAFSSIGFALTWYLPDGIIFIVACFATRIMAGIAVAASMVAGYGLVPFLCGSNISTGSGILETVVGFAYIAAPGGGSALYTLGGGKDKFGYVLPYVVLGLLQLFFGVFAVLYLPTLPSPAAQSGALRKFSPKVIIPCVICLITSVASEYIAPTLEPYLEEEPYKFSVETAGVVFTVLSLIFVVVGPLTGIVDDRFEGNFALPIMGLGLLLMAIGYIVLGPADWVSDFIHLEKSVFSMWLSMVLIGMGSALALIPTYNNMYQYAQHADEDSKGNAVGSLYNIVYALGGFLGPTVAGWLGESAGYENSYTDFGVFLMCLLSLLCISAPFLRTREASNIGGETNVAASMLSEGGMSIPEMDQKS